MLATNLFTPRNVKTTYQIVTSQCESQGCEGTMVYGICITHLGDIDQIKDISMNKREMKDLVSKLKRGNVAPGQLIYIIEDYLAK